MPVERLAGLLLNHISQWAAGAGERHVNDERIVLVIPAQIVNEPEVDDVDSEFRVHDIAQRLEVFLGTLRRQRFEFGHG